MFVRDKELRRGGGGGGRDERARVLQLAKEQRAARSQLKEQDGVARRLQAFLRSRMSARRTRDLVRRDMDKKLADIAQLKLLLQLPNMPLPLDALFDLLRKLLFVYRNAALDHARLLQLLQLLRDAGTANAAALQSTWQDPSRRWLLARLLDVCVQPPPPVSIPASTFPSVLAVVQELLAIVDPLRIYLLSSRIAVLQTRHQSQSQLFSALTKLSLPQLARQSFIHARSTHEAPGASTIAPVVRAQCSAMLSLLVSIIHSSSSSSSTATSFCSAVVIHILSVPLLPELVTLESIQKLTATPRWTQLVAAAVAPISALATAALPNAPVAGITSATWLLGNVLWLSERVAFAASKPPAALTLNEVQLLTLLLQRVPIETFAANGVAIAWTHVTASHSKPIVFPDALTTQLDVLLSDRFVRAIADALLWINASSLQAPLATTRPVPMHPTALSLAEQYGFGDIASESSLTTSLTTTWKRVRALGRASWATKMLEKTGLRRKSRNDFANDDVVDANRERTLQNTSSTARTLAVSGHGRATTASTPSFNEQSEPFALEHVRACTRLWTLFLFRWGCRNGRVQSHGLKLLNTLAFYQCPRHRSRRKDGDARVSLVRFLWCVLQETRNFEDFVQDVDLMHVESADAYICTLALFCLTYNHLLVVLDDEEMYDDEYPLPLVQVERMVVGLKRALHAAYWTHGNLQVATATNDDGTAQQQHVAFGMFVVDAATSLLRDLYNRCSRHAFCNVTSWVIQELDSNQLITEVLAGTPRANKLIASMPYLVRFPDRVKLFQRIIAADKAAHQSDSSGGYRVRIRRSMVLDDGLTKLNALGARLKQRINVVFVNAANREEVGIDAGGLFKEFWVDLATLAFDLEYGLFLTTGDALLYPNPFSASTHFARSTDHLTLFQFVGRILGKALYEGIVVDPKFAHFFLAKLLHSFNHVNDLPSLDPEIYKNLMFLKTYDGDVEDLGLTHTIVQDVFGDQREIELLPGGGDIPVTSHNRTRYIHLVANYYLNTQIRAQCAAFRAGLSDLIDVRWLQMFNEPELQVLISGKSGRIDVDDLRAHAKYAGGYFALDKRVQWLWQALASYSPSEQAAFLRFATSCQRAPSLGFSSLTPPFCVTRIPIRRDDELLPSSSTCFNTLKLPTYSSYKVLRAKLLISISSGAGFEMT